ncbi:MAG: hypothetical protein LBQ97_02710 [Fusobacteriaceae bacterium]|nr:hypothetical protein [Fusobacteriaceae bacterium]
MAANSEKEERRQEEKAFQAHFPVTYKQILIAVGFMSASLVFATWAVKIGLPKQYIQDAAGYEDLIRRIDKLEIKIDETKFTLEKKLDKYSQTTTENKIDIQITKVYETTLPTSIRIEAAAYLETHGIVGEVREYIDNVLRPLYRRELKEKYDIAQKAQVIAKKE